MIIYVDVNTLALTTEGHVPLTDMALVRGDKIPLRIVLTDGPGQPADARDVPVLAVKKSLGNDALVLAATGLERVEDALGTAYVGSLSVNTTQLAAVMGDQDRIELVGEVVLVAPDGAQRTSRLVRVTVRADLLPADYAPPEDVLADWSELVAASLASQLPDALHEAGMYVTPAIGTATLGSDMGARQLQAVTYYRLPLNHHNIVGHIASRYEVQSITIRSLPDQRNPEIYIELYKLAADNYELLGRSLQSIKPTAPNQDYTWAFPPGMMVRHDDVLIVRIVGTDGNDAVITLWGTNIGTLAGAGIVDGLASPQLQHDSFFLNIKIGVTYADGVSVGGVELATRDHFDALTQDVVATGEQVTMDAEAARTAKEGAQAILNAMPSQDQFDARYGSLGKSNTWAGSQAINGAISVGTGDDLNLYIHASGGPSASLSIADMRIYRGNNDGNFYVDTGIGSSLYFERGVYFYDAVNFAAGITLAQSLNVSGRATLKGGLGVGGSIVCYDDYGVQAATITGVYLSPDESGVVFGNGGSSDFLRIKYHSVSKYVDIHLLIPDSSLHLPLLAPISVDGSCSADSFQFGPNSLSYDSSNPTMVITSGFWMFGGAAFAGGVTMDSGLYVAGNLVCAGSISGTFTGSFKGTLDSLVRLDFAALSGGNPDFYWGCVPDMLFLNRARKGATQPYPLLSVTPDGVTMPKDFAVVGSATFSGRVSKQSQDVPLEVTDTPNCAEGDARWVKFNNTLTDAQYAALAVKDQTTMYITDTGKIYLGSYALN